MPDQAGTISGIDRTNRLVGARLDDGTALWLPQGFSYRGDPPPPLSICWFTDLGHGVYVCEGPLGDQRVIVHDDFTIVGVAPATGDGNWRTAAGSAPTPLSIADAQGVQSIFTTAVLNNFTIVAKSDNGCFAPEPPAALWYSARVAVGTAGNTAITTMQARWGLRDDGGLDGAIFVFDTAAAVTTWQLETWLAGASTALATATTVVSQEFVYLDIVIVAGVAVYGWVNGDGPYVIAATVPTTAVAFEPVNQILTRAASVRQVATDWVRLEYVALVGEV